MVLKSKDYVLVEFNSNSISNLAEKNVNFSDNLVLSNFKINLFFMVFSICLLGVYSYMLKDVEEENEENNGLKESQIESFLRLKKTKLQEIAEYSLQWTIHSIFIIFFLSIWDIADVFQYSRMNQWEGTNMNLFQTDNSNYDNFLNNLRQSKLEYSSMNDSINFMSNYFNKYDDSFYKHYYSHSEFKTKLDLDKLSEENANEQSFKIITKIKALFILKMHSQFLCDVLIVIIAVFVLCCLDKIEKFTQWCPNKFLKDNFIFQNDIFV
ncbi:unnamed protein product [Brachionus calyciflorus]|uniref:Uncharacterized protein n=1 Tax=Brachionus calyciflorus TaxID=104777 RepID=A0A814R4Y5_9BILA|nr:unnamed protein product [Brachionus calyciflorus]